MTPRWKRICGWTAASISTLVAAFWGFWGSIENFHEGWYFSSVWRNLVLMLVQYLSPMLVVVGLSAIAIRWQRAALPIFGTVAVAAAFFFHGAAAPIELIALPALIVGALYHFGSPEPRRWALRH